MATRLQRQDNPVEARGQVDALSGKQTFTTVVRSALLALSLAVSVVAGFSSTAAQAADWQPVSVPAVQVEEGRGLYDRRTGTFRATVTVTNAGSKALSGGYRLVLDSANKTPVGAVAFDDGCTPCFPIADLTGLLQGQRIAYTIDFERGRGRLVYSSHLEHLPSLPDPPTLTLSEPADGSFTGSSPVTVSGTVSSTGTGEDLSLSINATSITLADDGSFSAQVPLSEGANTLSVQVTDSADQQATAERTVHLDTTAPSITAQVSPAANAAGWHNSAVTVSFQCSDDGSGVAECPAPIQVTDNGTGQSVSATATDQLGHSASASVSLNIDTVAPTLAITSPTNGSLVGYSPVEFSGSASDATSGLAGMTCNGQDASLGTGSFNCEVAIAPGANRIPISLIDNAGNSTDTQIDLSYDDPPQVVITDPESLITVGASPLTVTGTLNDAAANLTVNGAPVDGTSGSFSIDVNLEEGLNTVVARAIDQNGLESTDSIAVSLDATEPHVTIDYPSDGQILYDAAVTVSGLVNDIVRGTVAADEANVSVNGVQAQVANRSYIAQNIPLQAGANTIEVQAADAVGNVGSTRISVTYDPTQGRSIELIGGQDQNARVFATLAEPLSVQLVESDGTTPVAGQRVVFRVVQGDGQLGLYPLTENPGERALAVTTNDEGIASALFAVGSHAGVGNNRVRAAAVGFDGEVLFHASATPNRGDKISIIAGNNQRGAVRQPLPQPLVVAVTDNGANLIESARVRFDITAGGGTFFDKSTSYETTTDNDGRASAQVILGAKAGLDVQRITATLLDTDSQDAVTAGFTASALIPAAAGNTSIDGVVLDNQDNPVPNVTLRIESTDGQPANREAVADAAGQFRITDVPVGPIHLIADGSTANTETTEWPSLSYNLVTVAGADNPLNAPIYLVPLNIADAKTVGAEDLVYTLPEVPGFSLSVKAGSVTFPDGAKQGDLSVTVVNANKIPMPPPNGMQPQFIVTIQPHGAIFDPPAPLTLPNVDGHAPGAQVEMYSYDHDLEEFVTIGLGTVSEDGTIIASNNGVGVVKAGWHCGSLPGGSGCSHNCGECQSCDASCTCYWDNGKSPTSITNTAGDCKKPACQNGPTEIADNDPPPTSASPDNECKHCDNKAFVVDPAKNDTCCSAGICKSGKCEKVELKSVEAKVNGKDEDYVPLNSGGTTVAFTSTVDKANCNVEYAWNFGDGGTSTDPNPSHKYTAVGENTVNITVKCKECPPGDKTDTVRVFVVEVESETIATTPADRARKSVGVGEEVKLTLKPTTASPVAWAAVGGGTLSATSGNSVTFTAHERASTPKITATVHGLSLDVDFTVIEPSGGSVTQKASTGIRHVQNTCSVGFLGDLRITPNTVSFYNIEFREGTANATASGSLGHWNGLSHPSWTAGVKQNNQVDISQDHIYSGEVGPPPPTAAGDFLWPLPWEFRVGSGSWKKFATINHHSTCSAVGAASIEKGGAGPFTKQAADPSSAW